jgi:phosphatidylglycerophosphate synthase
VGSAVRPVVLVYTAISILITIIFRADVNAQAGAYATGILAMMVSAAFAVMISAARSRERPATVGFGMLTVILLYALVENVREQPDGLTISAMFIAGIVAISLASRLTRALELRVTDLQLDATAQRFIQECARRTMRFVANEPDERDAAEYAESDSRS